MRKIFFLILGMILSHSSLIHAEDNKYFKIQVIDKDTDRGIPLVELKTVNQIRYYTDNNGVVAFYEPGLMGMEVFFEVKSHGYESSADGFGYEGVKLKPQSGESAVVKLERNNLAERLYRITGAGLFRDSHLTNTPIPIEKPLLNGQVMGQDSVLTQIYNGKIYWFWGDTSKPQYPLGNFKTSGATSKLPSEADLPPEEGINLKYFIDDQGFAKPICPFKDHGMIWIDGLFILTNSQGEKRMFGHYNHMESLEERLEHGLVQFDDRKEEFEKIFEFDLSKEWQCPQAHPIQVTMEDTNYLYIPHPFPNVRVPATLQAIKDQSRYEAFTCLKEGTTFRGENSQIERDQGEPVYAWKPHTGPTGPEEEQQLIEAGLIQPSQTHFLPKDLDSEQRIRFHRASVHWNDYREKWVMIGNQSSGDTSYLGEVWYSESKTLTGPWNLAQKIVTHDQYSFYNPVHHPFFDQQGGRILFFEGTYSKMFSDTQTATPRYDYNQILYRLDLSKLKEPFSD